MYQHVYLSPHLDDAALSCGGAIAAQRRRGERVLVVTACTGAPSPEAPVSELARMLHSQMGLSPAEAVAVRQREDRLAMARLGADREEAGFLDAIYRLPRDYDRLDALFGPPTPGDPLAAQVATLVAGLLDRCPGATLYAPLAVGTHVDHQAVAAAAASAARDGACVRFYEDFPYIAARPADLGARLAAVGAGATPSPELVDVRETLGQKADAIASYASQLGYLFGGPDAMRRAVAEHAAALGGAERFWRLASAGFGTLGAR